MGRNKLMSISSVLFIVLWSYAALSKLSDYPHSMHQMQLQMLPSWSKATLTWLIPFTELFLVYFLVRPSSKKEGIYISTLLMAIFTAYVVFVVFQHKKIPCSCGGIVGHFSWYAHLLFNLFWLTLGCIVFLSNEKRRIKAAYSITISRIKKIKHISIEYWAQLNTHRK